MHSFQAGFIERQPITQNLLRTVRLLGEYKGKEELHPAPAASGRSTRMSWPRPGRALAEEIGTLHINYVLKPS